eukprot:12397777-Karenia_brevis.AAC.1
MESAASLTFHVKIPTHNDPEMHWIQQRMLLILFQNADDGMDLPAVKIMIVNIPYHNLAMLKTKQASNSAS